jgi:hypothetical protein
MRASLIGVALIVPITNTQTRLLPQTGKGSAMHDQLSASRFHQHPLSRALMHLERAVSALGDADRTLADAGAADADRAAIGRAQVEIFEQESWINDELRYAASPTPLEMPEEQAAPIARASSPALPPSVASAIRQLFGAGDVADLETEFGQLVTVQLIELAGARLTATAPRLTLSRGMALTGRVIDANGDPWRVTMTCHDAIEQADDRMHLTLDVASVAGDDLRQTVRMGIDTSITLTVVAGANLREGDEVRGQLADISRSGLAFSAAADLRAGDRLMFHARFLEGTVEGELRVVSTRPEPGATEVGCWFASLAADSADVITRVMARHRLRPSAVSYPELRALFKGASSVAAQSESD